MGMLSLHSPSSSCQSSTSRGTYGSILHGRTLFPHGSLRFPYRWWNRYLGGYDPYVERFFRLWLVLFGIHQVAIALFRFNAALWRDMIVANTFGTGALTM
ncbi:hypothetical protein Droror1_Dr00026751 [Drosera rotundifolia]